MLQSEENLETSPFPGETIWEQQNSIAGRAPGKEDYQQPQQNTFHGKSTFNNIATLFH
jgi:hypothetical protein